MSRQRVVFSTSDIVRARETPDPRNAQGLVATHPSGTKFYTTGALERARRKRCVIYVVSTRSKLGDHDEWWLKLVPKGNVFLTTEDVNSGTDEQRNERLMLPWRRLFARIGLTFPDGKYDFWTQLRHDLKSYGLRVGYSYEERYQRQRSKK